MTLPELKRMIIEMITEASDADFEITENTHIVNEIGMSSVEIMLLISDIEDRFGISIPTSRLRSVETVADLIRVVVDTLMRK